jgi:hypothetical protein
MRRAAETGKVGLRERELGGFPWLTIGGGGDDDN